MVSVAGSGRLVWSFQWSVEYLLCDSVHLASEVDEGIGGEILFAQLDQGDSAENRVLNGLEQGPGRVVEPRVCDEVERVVDDGL